MLKLVSYEEMLSLIKKDHPFWVEEAQKDEAARYISEFDERLDLPLRQYLDTGEEPMFRYEEYSLYRIQNVKKGRSFLEAVRLMNEYIKDKDNGLLLIYRR